MPSITVKNIPDKVYADLKESAAANHRSINSQIIVCLEQAFCCRKVDVERVIRDAREIREHTRRCAISDEEINEAKNYGRP